MLARIAHDLYWLGRHIARAEHTARMLDGLFQVELEGGADDPRSVSLSWESVVVVMGAGSLAQPTGRSLRDDVVERLTSDRSNAVSIVSSVGAAREGARRLRDTIPAEAWEALNTFNLELQQRLRDGDVGTGSQSIYSYVKESSALYWGLAAATMQRDDAHSFLFAGGRIEAAAMVLRMLRVALPPVRPTDDEGSEIPRRDGNALALLRAVGGFQAFMRSAAAPPRAEPVARFLLFERAFPDSVAASTDFLHRMLSRADSEPGGSTAALRLARLIADLELRRRSELGPDELPTAFREIQHELEQVEREIHSRYFGGDLDIPQRATA
ncbi:MAG TPA: alpha-E domain-containing protein [Solirubrobacterales bacterium]|nr:alpha-E domain-containing protein [Solirubrobacterales bacterium]